MATVWLQLQGRSSPSLQALNTIIEIKMQGRPGSSWKGECTAQGCFCSRAQSHEGSWCGVWSQPSGGRAWQGGCGSAPGLKPSSCSCLGLWQPWEWFILQLLVTRLDTDSQCPAPPELTSASSAEELMPHKPEPLLSSCVRKPSQTPV